MINKEIITKAIQQAIQDLEQLEVKRKKVYNGARHISTLVSGLQVYTHTLPTSRGR